jgi:FixJ family two-component response regulator
MPGLSGATTPVVLITARSDSNLKAKAAAAACLLRKPFEINDLIGCIEGAVKG